MKNISSLLLEFTKNIKKTEKTEEIIRQQNLQTKYLEFIKNQNEKIGLPLRFRNARFSDFKAKTSKQIITSLVEVKKYANNVIKGTHRGGFLTLLGGVGTGETLLASILARNFIQNGLSVRYKTTNQIITMLYKEKRNFTTDIWTQIYYLTQSDILIIDEIGTQNQEDNNYLFEVVNQCYGAMKPMILVSNYDIQTLEVNTGIQIVDRLKHNGIILGLDWESFRK